ncbi:MAG TPA: polyamine ABC transporter substrate-binding protein [Reyranella sp.]|nr:polyamine ABC transporter substrate-binding protein [Reyranella sp.]
MIRRDFLSEPRTPSKKRQKRLSLAFLLALVAAPACAQGKVNVYNWSDYIAEDQLKLFEKDSGIKVNYTTYDSNEILDAKLRTGRAGYDVVVPTASPFFVRQLAAKLYRPLDKGRLKNYGNLDPAIMKQLAKYDADNAHAIPWMWGTIGIGYNVEAIKKRMVKAPVDSLSMIFEPSIVSRFADCGVMVLDSPTDVFPAALKYLLLDPDSKNPEDLNKAAELLKAIRPYIRKFHSSEYINGLATGNVCLTLGYSGDILQARDRAAKASEKREIAYAIPNQGAMVWIDVAAIPKDAPNPDNALRFLDFMMDPKVAAASSKITGYANANVPATELLDKSITGNPWIYPKASDRAKFYTVTAANAEQTRERTRLWTAVKTGR